MKCDDGFVEHGLFGGFSSTRAAKTARSTPPTATARG
jgi:hypothetical protein